MSKAAKYCLLFCTGVFSAYVLLEIFFSTYPLIAAGAPKDTVNVYVIGESSARGDPYAHDYNSACLYAKIVNYNLGGKILGKRVNIVDLAKSGNFLENEYKQLLRAFYLNPPKKGDILLAYIGTNDFTLKAGQVYKNKNFLLNLTVFNEALKFLKIKNTTRFQYKVEQIISLAKKFGMDVYISSICVNSGISGADVSGANGVIKNTAADYKAFFVNFYQKVYNDSKGKIRYNYFMDSVHPNLKGYILLADLFTEKIAAQTGTKYKLHTEEEVIKQFNIDDAVMRGAYIMSAYNVVLYDTETAKTFLNKAAGREQPGFLQRVESIVKLLIPVMEEDFAGIKSLLASGAYPQSFNEFLELPAIKELKREFPSKYKFFAEAYRRLTNDTALH